MTNNTVSEALSLRSRLSEAPCSATTAWMTLKGTGRAMASKDRALLNLLSESITRNLNPMGRLLASFVSGDTKCATGFAPCHIVI